MYPVRHGHVLAAMLYVRVDVQDRQSDDVDPEHYAQVISHAIQLCADR